MFLDFVPAHFAVDDYGLWNYDGTALYQYPSPDVGNSAWGSCSFMHSRGEVRSFLNSAARFWLEEYHFDGLRVDAVRNLIYWNGNEHLGENRYAALKQQFPEEAATLFARAEQEAKDKYDYYKKLNDME